MVERDRGGAGGRARELIGVIAVSIGRRRSRTHAAFSRIALQDGP
jgi:hypothetical protein